jgi:formylglycine-generating enzyme required for sulfatase activity
VLINNNLYQMTKKTGFVGLSIFLGGLMLFYISCNKTITSTKPPTVAFVVLPSSGTTSTTFVFDASETVDGFGGDANIKMRWDFENDGAWDTDWQTSKTQSHQYSADGYYTVGLQVEDSYGFFGWASRNLTVGTGGGGSGPGYPTAVFTVSPPEGSIGTDFIFDASGVSDNESPSSDLMVRWDYNGDNSWDTDWSLNKIETHAYSLEGNYNPKMEVKDPEGNTSSTSKSLVVNSMLAIEFVTVNGGTFEMGCTGDQGGDCEEDENPSHFVTLSSFSISRYEITNDQFAQFLNSVGAAADGTLNGEKYIHIESDSCQVKHDGSTFNAIAGMEQRAAIFITWYGANAFCDWAGGRLPTEAEWEYAARGGSKSNGYKYSGGNNINSVGWFSDNSQQQNHDIGGKTANELGIYDMSGNVREWCNDWFDYNYYQSSPDTDPPGATDGIYRVLRGGSFFVQAADCRVADRYWGLPENTFYKYEVGFRVAKN